MERTDLRTDLMWFLHNLDLEIQDRALQAGGYELDFYWDTADVREAVLGMAAFYKEIDDSFDSRLFHSDTTLVRCLAGAGWFGKIRLLRPHQVEFLNQINSEFHIGPAGLPRGGANRFVRDAGLKESFDFEGSLRELTHEQIAEIVREEAGNAPALFKVVHCVRRTWKSRLAFWINKKLFEVDEMPLDYVSIVKTPEFQVLKDALDDERPQIRMNNFADAMAICLLGFQLKEYLAGKTRRMPRFFASTSLYGSILKKTTLEHLLEYEQGGQSFSVLCDSDYYKLKAALHPPKTVSDYQHTQGLTELHDARDRLKEILEARQPLTEDVISAIELDGQPLVPMIQNLKRFWFLENVWLPFAAASEVINAVKEYTNPARRLSESPEVRRSIEDEIKNTQIALQASSIEYRWISQLWPDLEDAIQRTTPLFREVGPGKLELYKTTGLLRFGFPQDYHEDVEWLLQKLASGERHQQATVGIELIQNCQQVRAESAEIKSWVIAASIFWVLRLDKQLIELLSETDHLPHYSLRIIAAAARFRIWRGINEGWQIVKTLEREYANVHDSVKRLDLAVGLGYLCFHYWKARSGEGDGLDRNENNALVGMALSYAKEGYFDVKGGDLKKKVFALNQYLFYLTQIPGAPDWSAMHDAAHELLEHFGNPTVWQYRFDDTLVYYWEKRAASSPKNRRKYLDEANIFMERAVKHSNGDEEMIKHQASLQIAIEKAEPQ